MDDDDIDGTGIEVDRLDEAEYKVGYKKPPLTTRFKKGQSGNPRGREKGSRGLKKDLDTELKRKIEVPLGKYKLKGTTQQVTLRSLAILAANGDVKAIAQFLPLILQVFGVEDRGGEGAKLSAHDQAELDKLLGLTGEPGDAEPGDVEPEAEASSGGDGNRDTTLPAAGDDLPDDGNEPSERAPHDKDDKPDDDQE